VKSLGSDETPVRLASNISQVFDNCLLLYIILFFHNNTMIRLVSLNFVIVVTNIAFFNKAMQAINHCINLLRKLSDVLVNTLSPHAVSNCLE